MYKLYNKDDSNGEKVANIFSVLYNPLRSLTQPEIECLISDWHHGDDVRLQCVFSQIEVQSPIYQVCISKRCAGVLNRKWKIEALDDNSESVSQAKEVQKMFEGCDSKNEGGLTDALKWLVMSNFKGRSAIKAFFDDNGGMTLKKIQPWNLLEYCGRFYWNPSSAPTGWFIDEKGNYIVPNGLVEVPKSEICYLTCESPIDIPGLLVYLRQLVGEDQWARFVEKEGIPQVILNAPEGTPDTALETWNFRAQQIFEGGSGTLPNGTDVHMLTEGRGQDPFSDYIRHQMEMVSIMATGGTLMTIGGSTGLGSDLATVQRESFDELVSMDCKRISNAMTENVVRKCVENKFGKGAKVLCRFTFVEDEPYTTQEYIDMAQKLNGMGVRIDPVEFKKLTNLPFIAVEDGEKWIPKNSNEEKNWSEQDKEELKKEIESENYN